MLFFYISFVNFHKISLIIDFKNWGKSWIIEKLMINILILAQNNHEICIMRSGFFIFHMPFLTWENVHIEIPSSLCILNIFNISRHDTFWNMNKDAQIFNILAKMIFKKWKNHHYSQIIQNWNII